jgi:hypothetical protein
LPHQLLPFKKNQLLPRRDGEEVRRGVEEGVEMNQEWSWKGGI